MQRLLLWLKHKIKINKIFKINKMEAILQNIYKEDSQSLIDKMMAPESITKCLESIFPHLT